MQDKNRSCRNRHSFSNVVPFSRALAHRLDLAIERFDAGDLSEALADEFVFLSKEGMAEANFFIGCMVEDGSNGFAKDTQRAFANYEIAASEIGYIEAKLATAKLLLTEFQSPDSALRAAAIYECLAYNSANVVAKFRLGRLYETGLGVARDPARARSLYACAAKAGSLYGMLFLAHMDFADSRYFHWLKWRARALWTAVSLARIKPVHELLRPW